MHPFVNRGLFVGALLVLAACKRNDGMPDGQMAEMSETVGRLQVEQDKENHGFLVNELPVTDKKAQAAASASAKSAAPPRSVQISDEVDDHTNDDPDDPVQRPEIKVQGSGGGYRAPAPSSKGRKTTNTPSPYAQEEALRVDPGSPDNAMSPEAKKAYDAAYALVTSKQYDRALEELTAFQTKWPNHPYAENATYWRGECLYATGQYLRAAEQFENVVTRFGAGKKGADALLKLGMCHDRLGSSDRAREYWDRLRRDFPRSEATKKIPQSESTRRTAGPKELR